VAQQPAHDLETEPLGAGHLAIELRFEPVQQFPGKDHIRRCQPTAEGQMTMPSTISSTIVGSRTRGKTPTSKGRPGPAATTPSRPVNMGRRFQ
jgi:hypothetical protein